MYYLFLHKLEKKIDRSKIFEFDFEN